MDYHFDVNNAADLNATADVLFNKIRTGEITDIEFREEFYKFLAAQWELGGKFTGEMLGY
jgi:hypothetical protein